MHLAQMSWNCACELMQESARLETHGAVDSCRFELTHSGGWPTYARPVVEHVTWQRFERLSSSVSNPSNWSKLAEAGVGEIVNMSRDEILNQTLSFLIAMYVYGLYSSRLSI